MTWALLAGIVIAVYVLYRTFRRPKPKALGADQPSVASQSAAADTPTAPAVAAGAQPGSEPQATTQPAAATADVVPAVPRVGKDELVEMIDSLIEQYEEEIREMTPAQQKARKAAWEKIEEQQQMTQIDFSEEVIERFWGYKKGTTPEISYQKKLSLGRGVWYTMRQPDGT